jgi:CBS domain containing-hemolysin-like protein
MKPTKKSFSLGKSRAPIRWLPGVLLALLMLLPSPAHASIFKGEALDKAADVLTWIVLIIAPVIAIAAFWLVHILPEKIAEKKKHPQMKAIQCLCLLSLAFGGMLWPFAWLWAYTKPVLHKMAYGTDVAEELAHEKEELQKTEHEVDQLRRRLAELETKLAGKSTTDGAKA